MPSQLHSVSFVEEGERIPIVAIGSNVRCPDPKVASSCFVNGVDVVLT